MIPEGVFAEDRAKPAEIAAIQRQKALAERVTANYNQMIVEIERAKKEKDRARAQDMEKKKIAERYWCVHCGIVFPEGTDFAKPDDKCPTCSCNIGGFVYNKPPTKNKEKTERRKKMKWLPKLLRRVIVLWCGYGLVQLVLLVHPKVCWLADKWYWKNPDNWTSENSAILGTWTLLVAGAVAVGVIICGVHYFSKWLFNEKK